jgi:hypothetical protein
VCLANTIAADEIPVPRVVGPIRRARTVELRNAEFLRASTDRAVAFAKLEAVVEGAAIVRRELASGGED